jgi:hypothetical protein
MVGTRAHRRRETSERQLDPDVRTALLGEARAELGRQQGVRDEEDQGEEGEPREALRAVAGDGSQRVESDEGAEQEEEQVEAPEVLPELRLLLDGGGCGAFDESVLLQCGHHSVG